MESRRRRRRRVQRKRAEISLLTDSLDELRANERIEFERRSCDIFDLYDTLGTIVESISEPADDEVYVNLSAGSKITAIAGMIACMATGARPIYARPNYGPDGERIPDAPLHEEVAEIFDLPTYPIDRPSDTHVAFLAHIAERTTESASGRFRSSPSRR
ncbi:HFX_2341 family transcriptional regulator domain-containing protein [Haladaptatus salinisoli]|uniref:HFX_2341 family transcriptional regulator domain-containing protein n=1 Tax=Haladaptatus salinisoli TaxID=2884876 RepID=UPI001D09C2D2|nr:DUF6293 family protein [Haladaptatus salinisoli]